MQTKDEVGVAEMKARPVPGGYAFIIAGVSMRFRPSGTGQMLVQAVGRSNNLPRSRLQVHPPQQVMEARVVAEGCAMVPTQYAVPGLGSEGPSGVGPTLGIL